MLRQGHAEARRLIGGVRPPVLDESGVVPAIAHLVHEASRRRGRRSNITPRSSSAAWAYSGERHLPRHPGGAGQRLQPQQEPQGPRRLRQHGDQLRLEIRAGGSVSPRRAGAGRLLRPGRDAAAGAIAGGQVQHPQVPGEGTRIAIGAAVGPGLTGVCGAEGDKARWNSITRCCT